MVEIIEIEAESALLGEASHAIPVGTQVYFDVAHGRLNHYVQVVTSLFALALVRGWVPKIYQLSRLAFQDELSTLFEQSRHFYDIAGKYPPVVLRSNWQRFFGDSKFRELLSSCDPKKEEARQALCHELEPVRRRLQQPSGNLLARLELQSASQLREKAGMSLHLRRGDVGVLFRKNYVSSPIAELFEDEVFCYIAPRLALMPDDHPLRSKIRSWAWITEREMADLASNNMCHAAVYLKKVKPMDYYIERSASLDPSMLKVAFSDGFERHARILSSGSTRWSQRDIRAIIEDVEFGALRHAGFRVFSGEPNPCLGFVDLLTYAFHARRVIAQESGFPQTLVEVLRLAPQAAGVLAEPA